MLMIRTLRRVSSVLPLTRGLTNASTVVIFVALSIRFVGVHNTIHAVVTLAIAHILIDAETRPAACTATLTLVVSRECIATCEPTATLEAGVWTFASV